MSFASLDSTGNLARLESEYEKGNVQAGVQFFDQGVSYFRGVMIGMFCVLFFAALVGIVSGGYLLVAADNETYHPGFKSQARGLGGFNIAIMFVLWAISAFAVYVMVKYEKEMKAVVHHMVLGGRTSVRTMNEHLQVVQKAAPPSMVMGQTYVPTAQLTQQQMQAATVVAAPAQAQTAAPAPAFSFV